jgi:hypothetical protein
VTQAKVELTSTLSQRIDPDGPPQPVAQIVAEKEAARPPKPQGRRDHDRPPPRGPPSGLTPLLRFADLKRLGIVKNYTQLKTLIESQQFPPGRWISNTAHTWSEAEVQHWLDTRPTSRPGPAKRFHRKQRDLLPAGPRTE